MARLKWTRSMSLPDTKEIRRPSKKRPGRTPATAQRRPRPRHAREGKTTDPGSDPAWRTGHPAYAAQRSTENDQADHHHDGHQRRADPYRRIRYLCPPAGVGISAQDGLP